MQHNCLFIILLIFALSAAVKSSTYYKGSLDSLGSRV